VELAVTIADAARMLHCKRTRVFEMLKAGELKRVPRTGRETLVTVESITARLTPPAPRKRPASTYSGFQPVDANRIRRMLKADVDNAHGGDR
jgi:hypothetical protein